MRIFRQNGSLMIESDRQRAGNMERPSGMQNRIPSGEAPSGSEGLFERIVTGHEARRCGLPSKRNDKKHVVAIDKP